MKISRKILAFFTEALNINLCSVTAQEMEAFRYRFALHTAYSVSRDIVPLRVRAIDVWGLK